MLYEIHIPQGGSDRPRVENVHGDNWLDALRRGLAAAGLPAPARNLACDLQDDESVVITDTTTGWIYRVVPARGGVLPSVPTPGGSPLSPRRRSSAGTLRVSSNTAAPDASLPHDDPGAATALADPFSDDETPAVRGVGPEARGRVVAPPSRPVRPVPPSGPPPIPSATSDAVETLHRADDLLDHTTTPIDSFASPAFIAQRRAERQRRMESLEGDLAEMEHLGRDVHDACNFTLDVARAHIPSGAGSVLLIDARDRCLYFAAARGPKAAIVASQRIPLEVGIAGASIRQRQHINVRDPGRDPRFASNFADSVGYHPRSIVCAPIFAGNRAFGVIELLDREQRDAFGEDDIELLLTTARRLGEHFASLVTRKA